MAEMHHDERGYTVTLTDREYDALKTKALERDALAAELAACKTARDGWTRASDAAHARIRVLESALTEVKAVLRETHGGRHYEPECPECVWLDGATALETTVESREPKTPEDWEYWPEKPMHSMSVHHRGRIVDDIWRCWDCPATHGVEYTSDRSVK